MRILITPAQIIEAGLWPGDREFEFFMGRECDLHEVLDLNYFQAKELGILPGNFILSNLKPRDVLVEERAVRDEQEAL